MSCRVVVAPAVEPIDATYLRGWARIDLTGDTATDNEVTARLGVLIKAARRMCDRRIGVTMATTFELVLERFPPISAPTLHAWRTLDIVLPYPRVSSVAWVKYLDGSFVQQTLATSVWQLNSDDEPPRIELKPDQVWPTPAARRDAVRVRFDAGWADSAAVPEDVKAWIAAHAADMYRNPEGYVEKEQMPLPYLDALIADYACPLFQ